MKGKLMVAALTAAIFALLAGAANAAPQSTTTLVAAKSAATSESTASTETAAATKTIEAKASSATRASALAPKASRHTSTILNCGYLTCSVYLSQSQTRWANYNIEKLGGGYTGLAAFCAQLAAMSGPAAAMVGTACGAAWAVEGGFLLSAINHAAGDGGCLRIRTPVWWFYDDHSWFCRPN